MTVLDIGRLFWTAFCCPDRCPPLIVLSVFAEPFRSHDGHLYGKAIAADRADFLIRNAQRNASIVAVTLLHWDAGRLSLGEHSRECQTLRQENVLKSTAASTWFRTRYVAESVCSIRASLSFDIRRNESEHGGCIASVSSQLSCGEHATIPRPVHRSWLK